MTVMTSPLQNSTLNTLPDELWQATLQHIESRFSKPIYEMWIRPMHVAAFEGNDLHLVVQNAFARDWVENRLKDDLSGAIAETFGVPLNLHFSVAEATEPRSGGATQIAPVSFAPPRLVEQPKNTASNARYTFEEFVIGGSNRFAHAGAMAVASAPGRAYNPYFVYGSSGLGKTHLLRAIGHRIATENPQARIEYVTAEHFTNAFISAVESNTVTEFRAWYRGCDVLLLDDIQFLAGQERAQEEFFHTFNALHEAGAQIVLTADCPPNQLATLEARLRSRFEWGLIADVQRPDLETREAILRRKAAGEAGAVPLDVLAFIARIVTTSVRELEGALTRVLAYARITDQPVTLALAQETLKDLSVATAVRRITISKIKETVSSAHGITVREIDNGRRDQRVSGPRQIAMYISTELTHCSLPQIAREFNKQDHTTVMYARDRVKERMQTDEAYRNRVQQLLVMCQN